MVSYFFLRIFFLMWTIFKVFIEFVTILLLFMFWFFGHKACGILAPWRGIDPASPTLEGKVITTGQPRESLIIVVFCISYFMPLNTLQKCLLEELIFNVHNFMTVYSFWGQGIFPMILFLLVLFSIFEKSSQKFLFFDHYYT